MKKWTAEFLLFFLLGKESKDIFKTSDSNRNLITSNLLVFLLHPRPNFKEICTLSVVQFTTRNTFSGLTKCIIMSASRGTFTHCISPAAF